VDELAVEDEDHVVEEGHLERLKGGVALLVRCLAGNSFDVLFAGLVTLSWVPDRA
jgi:hypothetical protein